MSGFCVYKFKTALFINMNNGYLNATLNNHVLVNILTNVKKHLLKIELLPKLIGIFYVAKKIAL